MEELFKDRLKNEFYELWLQDSLEYVKTDSVEKHSNYEYVKEIWEHQGHFYLLAYKQFPWDCLDALLIDGQFNVVRVVQERIVEETINWIVI